MLMTGKKAKKGNLGQSLSRRRTHEPPTQPTHARLTPPARHLPSVWESAGAGSGEEAAREERGAEVATWEMACCKAKQSK